MVAAHPFTEVIVEILTQEFGAVANDLLQASFLLQYINLKSRAFDKHSKSRASYGNLYALYVLVEDYLNNDFHQNGQYHQYEGARFSDLFLRQRQLPFGNKLQNHALNHRLNEEFRRYFPTTELVPILRDLEHARYWINESLLIVILQDHSYNVAPAVLKIIDAYIEARKSNFDQFINDLEHLQGLVEVNESTLQTHIAALLRPDVDARIFEVVSYAILKIAYQQQTIYWGWSLDVLQQESLTLYRTGRTNANDGGIDFVMRPLGRFFQVTETVDVHKYFLDIDKIQKYPLTFVIKSNYPKEEILSQIRSQAQKIYPVQAVIESFMAAIEEIINLPALLQLLDQLTHQGYLKQVIDQILIQSKFEFYYDSN